jgi:molybdate transport system regulatory protein
MRVKSKLWLEKSGELVFGEGKSEILKAVAETGSLNAACRKMGISFRHGWGYITAVEKRLGFRLVERSKGGRGGGGSRLTPEAKQLMRKYDRLKAAVDDFTDDKFREIFGD